MVRKFYIDEELIFAEKPKGPKFQDIEGQRFGRLTLIGFYGRENNKTFWYCKCDCGNIVRVWAKNLKRGETRSCGCLAKEVATIHGQNSGGAPTPVHRAWAAMLSRCRNENNIHYPYYGGRGITVCERWLKFENFYEDMGERPRGASIDRIDNDKGYRKDNCRWATTIEQANNKSNNHSITLNDKTQTVAQWAEEIGISPFTIYNRINKLGWSGERALTTPARVKTAIKSE